METEPQFNFFQVNEYISQFNCEDAEEVSSWLAMYHSAMREDMSSYNPHEHKPLSFWVSHCPDISKFLR